MLTIIALAAAVAGSGAQVPPTRVTTSFSCNGSTRAITIAHGIGRDAVTALSINGKAVIGRTLTAVRTGLAPLDLIEDVTPFCGDGPDRIRIKGSGAGKHHMLMIFFGPGGDAAVREVG